MWKSKIEMCVYISLILDNMKKNGTLFLGKSQSV